MELYFGNIYFLSKTVSTILGVFSSHLVECVHWTLLYIRVEIKKTLKIILWMASENKPAGWPVVLRELSTLNLIFIGYISYFEIFVNITSSSYHISFLQFWLMSFFLIFFSQYLLDFFHIVLQMEIQDKRKAEINHEFTCLNSIRSARVEKLADFFFFFLENSRK